MTNQEPFIGAYKMRKALTVAALVLLLGIGTAGAHTMTIGYVNSGPGSVTFWYGSWHALTPPLFEGSFNLVGINGNPYPSTTVSFNQSVGCVTSIPNCPAKPTGLVDGTNNFYACSPNNLCATDVNGNGPVGKWQGVTFTGLAAGDYRFTYLPIANPSVDWAPANTAVQSSVVTLSGAIVGASAAQIPTLSEWAMILLTLMIAGLAIRPLLRRRI